MGETEVGTGLRAELRAYIEEAFLYLHPDVELATRTSSSRSA